jgi:hypothetical protein
VNPTYSTAATGYNTPSTSNDWRPAIGGAASLPGDEAFVAFQRELNPAGHWAAVASSDVYGIMLDVTSGNGVFGTAFGIDTLTGIDKERPAVSKHATGLSGYSWACAYQSYDNLQPAKWEVVARLVLFTGTLGGPRWHSDFAAQNTYHQIAPVVDGTDGRWAVAFSTVDLATTPGKYTSNIGENLWVERLDWVVSQPGPTGTQPPVQLASAVDRRFVARGIAYDRLDSGGQAERLEPLSLADDHYIEIVDAYGLRHYLVSWRSVSGVTWLLGVELSASAV